MLGIRPVNTARMRDDPTSAIGRYDILRLLPIAAFSKATHKMAYGFWLFDNQLELEPEP